GAEEHDRLREGGRGQVAGGRKTLTLCRLPAAACPLSRQLGLPGEGLHLDPPASFLKCELVTKSVFRYFGSVTSVVTASHSSPFGAAKRSKYSVTTGSSLYGTPFLRS